MCWANHIVCRVSLPNLTSSSACCETSQGALDRRLDCLRSRELRQDVCQNMIQGGPKVEVSRTYPTGQFATADTAHFSADRPRVVSIEFDV